VSIPPRLLILTDRACAQRSGHALEYVVAAAVDAGAPAVLFREKDLEPRERARLATAIARPVARAGAVLVVASDASLAADVGAAGVHLAASDPPLRDALVTSHHFDVVGRSCHSGADLDRAGHEGASYATLSPVSASISKPGYGPAPGADLWGELAPRAGRPPVLALGGVTVGLAGRCRDAGAWGVAVIGTVMGADDPGRATRDLLAAVATADATADTEPTTRPGAP